MASSHPKTLCVLSTAALIAALPASVSDASEVDVVSVTASSEIPPTFDRKAAYLIDGSGLNAAGQHTSAVEPNMWLSRGTAFGGDDLDPNVVFDLGAVYRLDELRVWNYNESPPNLTARGVNAVTVQYGTTPALGNTVAGITNFTQADGTNTYTGEIFDLTTGSPINARYVKFDIDSNHGGDNNFYGLSEVRFDARLNNVITGVTVEDFTSQLAGFNRNAVNVINGSGFDPSTGIHDTNATNMWLSDGDGVNENNEGENGLPTSISFDLGANYDLTALNVWNYNEAVQGLTSRGAREVSISVASGPFGSYVPIGLFEFDEAPGTTSDFGQLISLEDIAGTDNVRRIRFDINSNWGAANEYVGLSELRFSGRLVPEPTSLSLLALGGLALARRRR